MASGNCAGRTTSLQKPAVWPPRGRSAGKAVLVGSLAFRSTVPRRAVVRTPRHTTHLQDLPASVRITREKHALEGRVLEVLGHTHRQGTLYLNVLLPDKGHVLIPAAWTDLPGTAHEQPPTTAPKGLASVATLVHTRTVVDALLRRWDEARSDPAQEEDGGATGVVSHFPGATSNRLTSLGATEPPPATSGAHRAGATDQASHPTADRKGPE